MNQPATDDSPKAEASSLAKIVGKLAAIIDAEQFPTGDRAALRRLNPGESPSLAFYRFAFRHLPATWENQQKAWITLVAGTALMCPHPHRPDRPAGLALAEAGYSEARLERLLAAEDELLHTLLLRCVRFLAAKKESCNWVDFAHVLLTTDAQKRDNARLRIARDFYRNIRHQEEE